MKPLQSDASAFFDRAYSTASPKIWYGFSRPIHHNIQGLLFGHRFSKSDYGGMMRHTEAAMLSRWAGEVPEGGTIVEIGCYGGLSTSYLLMGSRRNRARIFSIDPFDSDLRKQADLTDNCVPLEAKPSLATVRERLARTGEGDRVELIEGYSQEVVRDWTRKIDFLWIDGNHDQAYQDFVDWSPFLNPAARVAFHDAHPRYGYRQVAEDARRVFMSGGWTRLEHVKGIVTGVRAG